MTLPANVRVNTLVPFPALVTGAGPIILKKLNGIWNISSATTMLAQQFPAGPRLATDFLIVYDEVGDTWFKVPLSNFTPLQQRAVSAVGDLPINPLDYTLNINSTDDLIPTLPLASSRGGLPLKFKNLPGSHIQTLTATAPDLLEGVASFPLGAGQSVSLTPYNDGVNNALGYAIES